MKTMLKLCVVATLCLIALSSKAATIGERRLAKKSKPTVELAVCTHCAKKFPRESLSNGFCSRCCCKEHQILKNNGVCRKCKVNDMKKRGTAKCCICNESSKNTIVYDEYNGKSIVFYCIDHWCVRHKSHLQLADGEYVCTACEFCKQQEKEREREAAEKEAKQQREMMCEKLLAEYDLLSKLADSAWPERRCEIHKWKAEYAPVFGGDYYTEDARANYAQNYMKALELQERGLLKCMCHDSGYVKYWKECCAKAGEAKKKWSESKQDLLKSCKP